MSRLTRLLFKFISGKPLFSLIVRSVLVWIEKVRFLLGSISNITPNSRISVLFSCSFRYSQPQSLEAQSIVTHCRAHKRTILIFDFLNRSLWAYVQSSVTSGYTLAGASVKEVLHAYARRPVAAVLRLLGSCRIIEKNNITLGGNQ